MVDLQEGRVYVTGTEGVQALELDTGKLMWDSRNFRSKLVAARTAKEFLQQNRQRPESKKAQAAARASRNKKEQPSAEVAPLLGDDDVEEIKLGDDNYGDDRGAAEGKTDKPRRGIALFREDSRRIIMEGRRHKAADHFTSHIVQLQRITGDRCRSLEMPPTSSSHASPLVLLLWSAVPTAGRPDH